MVTNGQTVKNAGIGALVSLVLILVPFSTVVGGGVAGYLEGETRSSGALVGGLAGLYYSILLFPMALIAVPLLVISPFGIPIVPGNSIVFVLVLLLIVYLYTIPTGVIGGILGKYLSTEHFNEE